MLYVYGFSSYEVITADKYENMFFRRYRLQIPMPDQSGIGEMIFVAPGEQSKFSELTIGNYNYKYQIDEADNPELVNELDAVMSIKDNTKELSREPSRIITPQLMMEGNPKWGKKPY